MVSLYVKPEVSSVVGFSDDVPVVDNATTESALMVQDGNTVILGGLVKDEVRTTRKGVPILAGIPIIKYLFSSNVDEKKKSELVILITPRIMTGREQLGSHDFTEQTLESRVFQRDVIEPDKVFNEIGGS